MVAGNGNSEGAFGAFLSADLIECDLCFCVFCPCFCNFYIFAKVFNFVNIFEMQSEFFEGLDWKDFGFGLWGVEFGFIDIFGGNIDGFIASLFGVF